MQGRSRPAGCRFRISMSLGHLDRAAVVIIAQIEWPCDWLNAARERTREGLRFSAARSTNGKGTTTTSPKSQITECLFVLRRIPFRKRVAQSRQVGICHPHLANRDNLATPGVEPFPLRFHVSDRLDGLLRPAVLADSSFLPTPNHTVDFEIDDLAGRERHDALLQCFAAFDVI